MEKANMKTATNKEPVNDGAPDAKKRKAPVCHNCQRPMKGHHRGECS